MIRSSGGKRGARLRSRSPSHHGSPRDYASEDTGSTNSIQSHEEEKSERASMNCSRSSSEDPGGRQKVGTGRQETLRPLRGPNTGHVVDVHTQKFNPTRKSDRRNKVRLRQKTDEEKKRESMERKSNVLFSMGRFQAMSPSAWPNGNGSTVKQDPSTLKTSEVSGDNKDIDDSSISIGSLPPPDREERSLGNSASGTLSASLDLSGHRYMDGAMNLSGHQMMLSFEQIPTSVTNEQWARFKLLGRIGLGKIQLSPQAEVLVERNYSIMLDAIKLIYSLRDEAPDESPGESLPADTVLDIQTGHLLEEVQSTIDVPTSVCVPQRDPRSATIEREVRIQLKDFIVVVASLYKDNSFHDYEHASNVLSAVDRLIGLVRLPNGGWDFRNLTYGCGIAREPWNHFALVFSAMIHDVDHNGVPNAQLIKEKAHVAGAYKNKCVAEQNSIEIAWNLLMEPCYRELREGVFKYRHELTNFRKLVVTAVMATDIADKELAALRKDRAADALKVNEDAECAANSDMDLVSRKATFVVETLIQVADVSHTMSSFSTFKKWNHRLYKEMYKAFKMGRAEQDPTLTWYKGEFGFFDFYIIPLAKKLSDCGINGDASQKYLNNAMKNRRLWEEKGQDIVKDYASEEIEQEKALQESRAKAQASATRNSDRSSARSYTSGVDFAGDDVSDADSVSISSEDESEARFPWKNARGGISPMFDRRQATFGKVPSKASLMRQGPSSREQNQSPCSSQDGFRPRPRSASPEQIEAASKGSPSHSSRSERLYGRLILKSSQSSVSPVTRSDPSRRRLMQKHKLCEFSPSISISGHSEHRRIHKASSLHNRSGSLGSASQVVKQTETESHKEKEVSRRGNQSSGSRSKSPSTTRDVLARSQSLYQGSSGEVVSGVKTTGVKKGGRRISRSASPSSIPTASSEERIRDSTPAGGKAVRRGRRPSRSRSSSPTTTMGAGNGTNDNRRTSEKGLKQGKRPSTLIRKGAA